MIPDVFMKPLNVKIFVCFRAMVLGIIVIDFNILYAFQTHIPISVTDMHTTQMLSQQQITMCSDTYSMNQTYSWIEVFVFCVFRFIPFEHDCDLTGSSREFFIGSQFYAIQDLFLFCILVYAIFYERYYILDRGRSLSHRSLDSPVC